jgi:NADH-quinone oxidoreductase subunit N
VLGAFTVLCLVLQHLQGEDVESLAGLNQRSPLLAATMTLAMVSLGGIPPLAGFFGKFLLFKAALVQGATQSAYYWLVAIAIAGVVISLYYYFAVIRVIFWSREVPDLSPIKTSKPIQVALYGCVVGMFLLGIYPNPVVNWAAEAVQVLR